MSHILPLLTLLAGLGIGYALGRSRMRSKAPDASDDEDIEHQGTDDPEAITDGSKAIAEPQNGEESDFADFAKYIELSRNYRSFQKDEPDEKKEENQLEDIYHGLNTENKMPGWFDQAEDVLQESPEEDDDEDTEPDITDAPAEDPYIISFGSYLNTYGRYKKDSVKYFAEDHVYFNEDDHEIIDDPDLLFGKENLSDLDYVTEIYIRNDHFGTDYAIERVDGSYQEEYRLSEGIE